MNSAKLRSSLVYADVGLIHGSGFTIDENGSYGMSTNTRHNAEKAAELLHENRFRAVICSGRGPIPEESYATTEAQLMADHLISLGISDKQIVLEGKSTSTIENWVNSVEILEDMNAETVLGVTNGACCKRMELIGDFVTQRCGIALTGYVSSTNRSKPKDSIREIINTPLTAIFLARNTNTTVDRLPDNYDNFKRSLGMSALKRYFYVNQKVSISDALSNNQE